MNTGIFKQSCESFKSLGLRQQHLDIAKYDIPANAGAFVSKIKASVPSKASYLKEFLLDVDAYSTVPTNMLIMTFAQLEDNGINEDDFFVSLTTCLAVLAKEGIAVILKSNKLTIQDIRVSINFGNMRKVLLNSIGILAVNTSDDEVKLFQQMLRYNRWSGFMPSNYKALLIEADSLMDCFTNVSDMFRAIILVRLSGRNNHYKSLFLSLIRTLAHVGMCFKVKGNLLYFEQVTANIPDIDSVSDSELEQLFTVVRDKPDNTTSDTDLLSDFLQQAIDAYGMHCVAECLVNAVKYSSSAALQEDTANAIRVAMRAELKNRDDK